MAKVPMVRDHRREVFPDRLSQNLRSGLDQSRRPLNVRRAWQGGGCSLSLCFCGDELRSLRFFYFCL